MPDEPNGHGLDELRTLIEQNTRAIESLRQMIENLSVLLATADPSEPSNGRTDVRE